MYAIGDKIVYPMHGAGFIEDIETRCIGGRKIDYYVIRILNGNIKLFLPVESKSDIRLRPVSSPEQAKKILRDFEAEDVDPNIAWQKRYQFNLSRLKEGDLENVSKVVRELIVRDATHGLSTEDRKMYILARGILAKEISIVLGIEEKELSERFSNIIKEKLDALVSAEG